MQIFRVFILGANFVVTIVAYYKQCYESYSLCLITNIDDVEKQHLRSSKHRLNQSSAADWCERNSSSLAIITNGTVEAAIEAFIKDPKSKLTSDIITFGYRYPLSNWHWISEIQSDIYPNANVRDDYRYAYLSVSEGHTAAMFSRTATFKKKIICSYRPSNRPPTILCSNNYQRLKRRCYKVRNETATWFEARNLCLQDGSDLATYEDGLPSSTSEKRPPEEYWIGLRRESWDWRHDNNAQTFSFMKYSNWDDNRPSATGGNCLCVLVTTGKWRDCHCSETYRYICVQAYSPSTSSSAKPSTTVMTTRTSQMETTPSATMRTIPTVGDPHVLFNSTQAQKLDENPKDNGSGVILALGIGGACLLILIGLIVAIVVIKNRRSRSGEIETRQKDYPPQHIYETDVPNNVYAMVVPNTNEAVRSASKKPQSEIVYAELDLAPAEKMTQRSSTTGKTPNQIVHGPAPKGSKRGRSAAFESEYANSIPLESVYDNIAPSRV